MSGGILVCAASNHRVLGRIMPEVDGRHFFYPEHTHHAYNADALRELTEKIKELNKPIIERYENINDIKQENEKCVENEQNS